MGKHLILFGSLVTMFLIGCSVLTKDKAISWVSDNNARKLEEWLNSGGDPNQRNQDGCTLLYVATGPHGGNDVVRVLIAHAGDVNAGCGKDTPLMNAARWCNDEAVLMLLKGGADPNLKNEEGQSAVDLIGNDGNHAHQELLRQTLLAAMNNVR